MHTKTHNSENLQQRCQELELLLRQKEQDLDLFKKAALEAEMRCFKIATEYKQALVQRDRALMERERQINEVRLRNEELQDLRDKYQGLAMRDDLTGIYNRRYFFELLINEMERCRRYSGAFSLLMFDIDNFKHFNDTHGHLIGDEVLRHCCDIVKDNIRKSDIFSRFGGEEFMIILPETELKSAGILAEKLRHHIDDSPLDLGKQELHVTASFGGTGFDERDMLKTVIERVDNALYMAKERGRNRVELAYC
ncbi:MAG: hypothetical protein CVV44_17705 [Spirochaetae bacterium HGW-Spirochaetae-1]|jgi:diguanylate cyclase (GGDEF)-like protein|nr:MAG: hypothetical protein CVV44_17705 [Spirochaetae bacterium HGW-Spirochaetae-1]